MYDHVHGVKHLGRRGNGWNDAQPLGVDSVAIEHALESAVPVGSCSPGGPVVLFLIVLRRPLAMDGLKPIAIRDIEIHVASRIPMRIEESTRVGVMERVRVRATGDRDEQDRELQFTSHDGTSLVW